MKVIYIDAEEGHWPSASPSYRAGGADMPAVRWLSQQAAVRLCLPGGHWLYAGLPSYSQYVPDGVVSLLEKASSKEIDAWSLIAISDHGTDHTNYHFALIETGEVRWNNVGDVVARVAEVTRDW